MFLSCGDIFGSDVDAVFLRRADVRASTLLFETVSDLGIRRRIVALSIKEVQRVYMAPGQQLLRTKARWNR
jgi:hypothetical protein